MTDIQRARDVLAKWRELIYDTEWEIDTNLPFSSELVGLFVPADKEYAVKFEDGRAPHVSVARLIVGTAGNPDLLDAIDGLLAEALRVQEGWPTAPRVKDTVPLAAAIIAADERMSA
jgi:hypothetical protein